MFSPCLYLGFLLGLPFPQRLYHLQVLTEGLEDCKGDDLVLVLANECDPLLVRGL